MKNKRVANIELLRVIIMLFIVIFHFICHGMKLWYVNDMPLDLSNYKSIINYSSTWFITIVTSAAVNTYILITGYFLGNVYDRCLNLRSNYERIIKILIPTITYSIVIGLINCFSIYNDLTNHSILYYAFPILNRQYWFVTMYIGLIAISPFLNTIIGGINKKHHLIFLITMLVICLRFTSTIGYSRSFGISGTSLLWFVTLYLTGSYLRKYDIPNIIKSQIRKILLSFSVICSVLFIIRNLCRINVDGQTVINVPPPYNNVTIYILSVLLLLWAANINNIKNIIICKIAKLGYLTFGVYLIHDNNIIREILWDRIINANIFINSWFHIPYH